MLVSLGMTLAVLGALTSSASGVGPVVDAYFLSGESIVCPATDVALRPATGGAVFSFTCSASTVRHGCKFITGALYLPFSDKKVMVNCDRVTPDAVSAAAARVFKSGFE